MIVLSADHEYEISAAACVCNQLYSKEVQLEAGQAFRDGMGKRQRFTIKKEK